jgi:hypothetical protein
MVHEAGRRAVALGPVRADVAVNLVSKARTQILATQAGGVGTAVTFTLYRLQEAVLPSNAGTWIPVSTYTTDRNTVPVQWAAQTGDQTMPGLTGAFSIFSTQCRPDGTCDARTLFFQAAPGISGSSYELLAKLAIMPLGGAITTRTDWN